MTVTAQDLADYSPFEVSEVETGPRFINTDLFLKFAVLAKKKFDREDPGLETEEADHAQALLIAHYIAARQGNLERSSEKLDNYSYEKRAGMTSFLLQYNQLLGETRAHMLEKPSQLIAHADTALGNLKLDQAELPLFFDPADVSGEPDEP